MVDILDIAKSINQSAALGLDQHFMGLDQGHFHAEIQKRAVRRPGQSAQQAYRDVLLTPDGNELYQAYKRAPAAPPTAPQDLAERDAKPSPGPFSQQLAALARKLSRERRTTYARAYTQILTSPDHAELAARVRDEERQASRAVFEARRPIWRAQESLEQNWRLGRSPGSARN
jgi:hypothetical protein